MLEKYADKYYWKSCLFIFLGSGKKDTILSALERSHGMLNEILFPLSLRDEILLILTAASSGCPFVLKALSL